MRARIVEAAADLVYSRGASRTSLDDVMAASGVSKSQLYHYFADKDALIHEVIALQTERVLKAQQPHLDALDSLPALRRWRDAMIDLNRARRGMGGLRLRAGAAAGAQFHGAVVVSSEKAESEIPDDRRPLYDELLRSGRVQIESIMPGSRAAALLRRRQAVFGDALVILGGGTGVEHSADLYLSRRKPVVPFDLALGASRDDGTGGALRLAKRARAEPNRFLRFGPAFAATEGAALAEIATRAGAIPATDIADRAIALLGKIARPNAFYVRLLNAKHPKFAPVESFFRNVVDPVVEEAGMSRVEIGTDKSDHAFMNAAIFESLHFASLAIVDVTGERPNCFIELGYALGNANRVLVTAEEGTKLPFDQEMIPCHFWNASSPFSDSKNVLVEFWKKNINRPSIVKIT